MTAARKFWEMELLGQPGQEGAVYALPGGTYVYREGILRQLGTVSAAQSQTEGSFGFKWRQRDTYESTAAQSSNRAWLLSRYCAGEPKRLADYFPEQGRVLDAGCGSGHGAMLLMSELINRVYYLGVDISEAVDVARARFAERELRGEFIQADFTRLPFASPVFDAVFAEGTLHHTDSTRAALASLTVLLKPGGYVLFYVYRKKGPIREFCDDYIREHLKDVSNEQAWRTLMPLTKLGKALGDLNVRVDVPEAVPFLQIPAGSIDLQRLFYWHVFKAFYHPDFTLEEMNHVNFDWYRPQNAHRHTPEEVQTWCSELGLQIAHLDVQESGVTVVAQRLAEDR